MSRTTQQQTRRFDHVYDTTYTVSGYRDHERASQRALVTSVERVPNSENLFSEIPTVYQSFSYRTTAKNDLPSHMKNSFTEHRSNANVTSAAVTGTNRPIYFRRPVVPVLHSAPPEVLLAQVQQDHLDDATQVQMEAIIEQQLEDVYSGPVERGMQTMYRESEAQTVPYTPDFVVPEGTNPEILSLADLKFNKGLPATMEEVERIERAREKKKFLASLPPITDEASFNLRKRMMEEQELREFRYREEDIDRVQAEHLRLLKQALDDREAETQFVSEQRIEAMRQAKLEEKDEKILEIQKMRIRQLRKLAKARSNVDPRHPQHKIIDEYSNFASAVYAPKVRDGLSSSNAPVNTKQVELQYVEDLGGLVHLESSMSPKYTKAKTNRPRRKQVRSAEERKRQNLVKHLDWMDQLLRKRRSEEVPKSPTSPGVSSPVESKMAVEPSRVEARQAGEEEGEEEPEDNKLTWRRRADKLVRPPTPRVSRAGEDARVEESGSPAVSPTTLREGQVPLEVLDSSITLLQRLIRGRAIQTMMYEGKLKRKELIRELRTEEDLIAEAKAIEEDTAAMEVKAVEQKAEAAAWGAIQGEVVSSTLDLLSKELVRMQQERELSSFIDDAMETRRRREMIQAGTRQAEQQQRDREDEVYKQLMLVHRASVDSYFDEILGECIEVAASEQALVDVQVSARPRSATSVRDEESGVVHDLVSSFLLPHVERASVRSQLELQERRFVQAAHRSIYEIMHEIEGTGRGLGELKGESFSGSASSLSSESSVESSN